MLKLLGTIPSHISVDINYTFWKFSSYPCLVSVFSELFTFYFIYLFIHSFFIYLSTYFMPFMWNAFFKSFMSLGSQLDTINRQVTNLMGLEMCRHDQVAPFRPFLSQQNRRDTGRMFTFARRERLWGKYFPHFYWFHSGWALIYACIRKTPSSPAKVK